MSEAADQTVVSNAISRELNCEWKTEYASGGWQKATFVRFGDSYYTDEGNHPHPMTIAIVITTEGQVLELKPGQVRMI